MSSGINIAKKLSSKESPTVCYLPPRFSATLTNSSQEVIVEAIRDWLMQSLLASHNHASLSASPAGKKEKRTTAICGRQRRQSFASYDRDSCCWRMSQGFFLTGTLGLYSGTWPRSGMIAAGVAYRLLSAGHRTSVTGCGLSESARPTPRAGNPGSRPNKRGGKILAEEVHKSVFPTPRGEDGESCGGHRGSTDSLTAFTQRWPTPLNGCTDKSHGQISGRYRDAMRVAMNKWPTPDSYSRGGAQTTDKRKGHTLNLQDAVKTWPTPTQSDHKGSGPVGSRSQAGMLAHGHLAATAATAATGQLNPDWVETLMGWPQGWTRPEPLAADAWQDWLHANRWQNWEPDIPRVIVGAKDRANRLKAIGNGQVPACVAEIGAELMNLFTVGHSESRAR